VGFGAIVPHPPFGHLLPRKGPEKAFGCYRLHPFFSTGEGARRADEGDIFCTVRDGIALSFRLSNMAHAIPRILENARNLRRAETAAEIRLWEELRGRRLNGFKFVRQLPIGFYIADFACRSEKLIVEVDGATHGEVHEVAYDQKRTAALEAQGWRVVRVNNEDVFKNLNDVCDYILWTLEQ
jgi:very-short-patch-repair endonuclease